MWRIAAWSGLLLCVLTRPIDAGEWRQLHARQADRAPMADTRFYGSVTGPGRVVAVRPWAYYRGKYPRYVGGFHAREIQNLAVPSGDVGLRGNGLFWSPW